MKKIFLSFLFICLAVLPAHAAITLINHVITQNTDTSATPIDTTGANFIVVACCYPYEGTATITDSANNTWNPLPEYGAGSNTNGYIQIAYAYNNVTTSASHVFYCAQGGGYQAPAVLAFSGVKSSSDPIDGSAVHNSTSGSTSIASGNYTPAQAGDVLVSIGTSSNSAGGSYTITPSSTFSTLYSVGGNASQDIGISYYVAPDANTYNTTWYLGGTDTDLSTLIIGFKSASLMTTIKINNAKINNAKLGI